MSKNIFNNKTIGMILDREMMNQDFKKFKSQPLTRELFDEYCELLKRYQQLNHEIFTYELVEYISQFETNDELFQFDNYKIIKSWSSYLGQGSQTSKIYSND